MRGPVKLGGSCLILLEFVLLMRNTSNFPHKNKESPENFSHSVLSINLHLEFYRIKFHNVHNFH